MRRADDVCADCDAAVWVRCKPRLDAAREAHPHPAAQQLRWDMGHVMSKGEAAALVAKLDMHLWQGNPDAAAAQLHESEQWLLAIAMDLTIETDKRITTWADDKTEASALYLRCMREVLTSLKFCDMVNHRIRLAFLLGVSLGQSLQAQEPKLTLFEEALDGGAH